MLERKLNIKRNDKRKYLLISAIVILMMFCGYFYFAFNHINEILLKEKYSDRKFNIDLICDEIDHFVEFNNNWEDYDYGKILSNVVSKTDATLGTYAELFDEGLNSLSQRSPLYKDAPLDPKEYPELVGSVRSSMRGETSIWFDKEGAIPQTVHIYYRWVPTDNSSENKLLVILGVSKYSVDTSFESWIIYGAVSLIIISAVLIISAVVLLCYLWNVLSGKDRQVM